MSSTSRMFRRRIGEILVSEGLITPEQLDQALAVQKVSGDLLGTILLERGWVSETDLAKTACIQYHMPFISIENYDIDEKLVQLFPRTFLKSHKLLPFDQIGDTILLVVSCIPPPSVLEEIPQHTQKHAALYVGYESQIDKALATLLPEKETVAPLVDPARKAAAPAPRPKPEAARPAPAKATQPTVKPAESEADDESGAVEGEGMMLDLNQKNFLEELDSTWEALFKNSPLKITENSGHRIEEPGEE